MSDLMSAMSKQNFRHETGAYQVSFTRRDNTRQTVRWLSFVEAAARAVALKARGYAAQVEPMPHTATLTFAA